MSFEGIVNYINNFQRDKAIDNGKKWTDQFVKKVICQKCNGHRLKTESLHFKFAEKNIAELADMDIDELYNWFSNVEEQLSDKQKIIARDILKEIRERLSFLLNVSAGYYSPITNENTKSFWGFHFGVGI